MAKVRQWEIQNSCGKKVVVLASDRDEAMQRAARLLSAAPFTKVMAFGPWSRA